MALFNGAGTWLAYRPGVDQFSQLTIAGWLKPNASPVGGSITTLIGNGSSPRNFVVDYRNQGGVSVVELSVTHNAGTFTEMYYGTGTNFLPTTVFSHICVTVIYAASWVVNGYLSGISQSITTVGTTNTAVDGSDANQQLAASTSAGAGSNTCQIADIAVWSAALTPPEVYALAKGFLRPGDIRPNKLAAWWPLDGYVYNAFDASGNGHTAVPNNTAIIPVPGPPLLKPTPYLPSIVLPPNNMFRVVPPVLPTPPLMAQIWM